MAMNTSNIFFTLLMFITIATILSAPTTTDDDNLAIGESNIFRHSRFLAYNPRPAAMTCNKYPTVCRAKGSAGPHCCKKQCVNVLSDELNCGRCGNKCKYSQICCRGKCVNPSNDKYNCGKCNNSCAKGSSCVYGLCSYA
ncbi:stigma-specific STIG1-like protein 1 [Mercurialis annua]|uniref:stigma-specific STIG1-like protein 1 n=1 Tax=Mercurialis annua TaxID=3986 RepID=UPI00215F5CEB|nr:stigma-specific STIG1-like protein 1 [Mercurialis annua]